MKRYVAILGVCINYLQVKRMSETRGSKQRSRRNAHFCAFDGTSQFGRAGRAAGFGRLFPKESMFFEYFARSSATIVAGGGGLVPLGRAH